MCIIHYGPENIDIPEDSLINGAAFNNDGHGWAVASGWGLEVGKSMDFETAALTYMDARQRHGKGSLALFHSRWGTHGVMGEYNVHPFYVDEDRQTVMAHNGILPFKYHPAKGDPRSDTRIFVDEVASEYLTERGVPSRRGGKDLGKLIGSGNKLLFLSVAQGIPKVRIINAHLGVHDGGVWYSNDGYKSYTYTGYRSWEDDRDWYTAKDWRKDTDGVWKPFKKETKEPIALGTGKKENECDPKAGSEKVDYGQRASSGEWYKDCPVCGAYDTVEPNSRICEICDGCADCQMEYQECGCYSGISHHRGTPASQVWGGYGESWDY